jgi:hypothetical protein
MEKLLKWLTVAGLGVSGGILLFEHNWELAITTLILPLLIALIPILFQNKTKKENSKPSRIKSWLTGRDFQKQFFTLLQYQHRDFDIKGLSTQTVHTLDLEQVFVELKLQPQVAHNTSSNPLSRKPNKLRSDSFPIWHFFGLLAEDEKAQNAKLAIVGPPGREKRPS